MGQRLSRASARWTILAANAADVEAATGRLDEGTLDRLRLDEQRIESLARQVEAMAEVEPLDRDAGSWRLENGLQVTERRIPIGTVGANFEARPNVALDVAGQLLKSLNTAVLRTGAAALGTVTVLVDEILRPALEAAGLPPGAVGLVRSGDREGARALVSLPKRIPLVILRGSGETTAALARLAAENGVRTLAHAEGGGVLYIHSAASASGRSRSPRTVSTGSASATGSTSPLSIERRRASCRDCSSSSRARARGARRRGGSAPARSRLSVTSGRAIRTGSRR